MISNHIVFPKQFETMNCLLLIALVLPACLALPLDKDASRIVGGSSAFLGQFPHQISLQVNGQHSCGGSIISPTKILTAAHCVYGMSGGLTVVVGINNLGENGQRYTVSRAVYHGAYDPQQIINDVAVLTLSSPISYNNNVQPISLATSNPGAGRQLTLSGWGLTSYPGSIPSIMQWINLSAIDLNECAGRLAGYNPITNGHVCTSSPAGQGACQGDSGGPLIDESRQQVGVVSWGIPCAKGLPDVFTSVAFYYGWIVAQ